MHDPESAELRREASRRGGRNRANAVRAARQIPEAMNPEDLAGWLSLLFTSVMAGRIEPKIGTACAAIARTMIDVRQQTELVARIADLEERAGVASERWGA